VRGDGAALPSRQNGAKHRLVEESEYFKLRRRKLAPHVPRIREVLAVTSRQLAHNAEQNAIRLDGGEPGKWVRATVPGTGAPAMWIYYSLSPTVCRLEMLALAAGEPPGDIQNETVL
jgi:hypothetical protein